MRLTSRGSQRRSSVRFVFGYRWTGVAALVVRPKPVLKIGVKDRGMKTPARCGRNCLVLAVCVISGFVLAGVLGVVTREPSFEGRTVHSWLRQAANNSYCNFP